MYHAYRHKLNSVYDFLFTFDFSLCEITPGLRYFLGFSMNHIYHELRIYYILSILFARKKLKCKFTDFDIEWVILSTFHLHVSHNIGSVNTYLQQSKSSIKAEPETTSECIALSLNGFSSHVQLIQIVSSEKHMRLCITDKTFLSLQLISFPNKKHYIWKNLKFFH